MRDTERFGNTERRFARLDGVYDIFLYHAEFVIGEISVQKIHFGGAYLRAFATRHEADALRSAVRALIELTGKVFDRKHAVGVGQFFANVVEHRLGEHRLYAFVEKLLRYSLGVVAVKYAEPLKPRYAEKRPYIGAECGGVG